MDNYVAALGHNYVLQSQSGNMETYRCSRCGDTYTQSHQHNYTEDVTEPTCLAQGYTTFTCACGHSYEGDYVAALGHDAVLVGQEGFTLYYIRNLRQPSQATTGQQPFSPLPISFPKAQ